MKTVFVYVNTNKRSATPTMSRCSRMSTPQKSGSRKMTPMGWHSNMRSWSEPHRPPHHHVHAADCGACHHLEFARSLKRRRVNCSTIAVGKSLSPQFGYNFQNAGGIPLTVYAGFDTLKYNAGIGGPFAPFDTMSGTLPGYSAHAGVEFQPTPNVSLSLGFGYTQQSGRIDSDINSLSLPGASPFAVSGRR
jgi:hypothetical protein